MICVHLIRKHENEWASIQAIFPARLLEPIKKPNRGPILGAIGAPISGPIGDPTKNIWEKMNACVVHIYYSVVLYIVDGWL